MKVGDKVTPQAPINRPSDGLRLEPGEIFTVRSILHDDLVLEEVKGSWQKDRFDLELGEENLALYRDPRHFSEEGEIAEEPKGRFSDEGAHPHYSIPAEVEECIDLMRFLLTEEEFVGYLKGNAIKYLIRADRKNGLDDWEKLADYATAVVEEEGT